MNIIAKKITNISLEKEIKTSYLNYAMSIIIGRALPDVRDGLKPVHRRILYSMFLLNNFYNKPYKKSARIVGDVIGKYHPHGDTAVYETIVRMVQNFVIRYPLIDGQGNFGSIDGDSAAAMRYTEIRMSKIAKEILSDIDKKTIKFIKNYDNTELMPNILPSKIPNLLINGSSGIAVGMTTNIPPHNINEILNGCLAYINNKNITVIELLNYIKGPDFPTGGIIYSKEGFDKIYSLGKGKIYIRMKYKILSKKNIIIYEIPYQINKSNIIILISDLIKNKKFNEIKNIKDESDKDGIRIKIEVKKDFSIKNLINKLFLLTPLQISFNINMVALKNNQPKLMNLKEIISNYINFRCEIVVKKFIYLLNKNKDKIHKLEGLLVIINNLENVINIIKNSKNNKSVIKKLSKLNFNNIKILDKRFKNYFLTIKQIITILNLKLQQLTNIEINNILNKYKKLNLEINYINKILNDNNYLMEYIKNELLELKKKYGDKRKSIIINNNLSINNNLIKKKKIYITFTKKGYIQLIFKCNIEKIKKIIKLYKKDYLINYIITNTHKQLLCLSNLGKLYNLKISLLLDKEINKSINNFLLLNNNKNEKIINFIPINKSLEIDNYFLIIITINGIIKKIKLPINIYKIKNKGINILKLYSKDKILSFILCELEDKILIITSNSKILFIPILKFKLLNNNAYGSKGIKLLYNDKVISLIKIKKIDVYKEIFILTEHGYGKRMLIEEFNLKAKGLKGILALPLSKKDKGLIYKAIKVNKYNQLIIITSLKKLIRIKVKDIPLLKRKNQTRIIYKLKKNEKIVGLKKINIKKK